MTKKDKVIEAARAVCSAKHITRSRPDIHGPVDDRIDELLGTLHALDATPDESVVVDVTVDAFMFKRWRSVKRPSGNYARVAEYAIPLAGVTAGQRLRITVEENES